MSPAQTREKPVMPRSLLPAPRPQQVVTWAEQADCTCPETCERDHERD